MNKIKIDVWSDVVCPFCYLGKAKLERAINKLGLKEQVDIEWHSFLLDPQFPGKTSVPATEHLVKRKGIDLQNLLSAQQRLAEQGKQYQLDFQFERALNFNTLDVHRLIHWSKAFQKSNELKAACFKAHFSDGLDLSKTQTLLSIVASIGLDKETAFHVLQSDSYKKEVQHDIAIAQQIGISGVPFFVFNQKTAISGAQTDSVFEAALVKQMAK